MGSATVQFSWLPFWLYLHLLFEVLFIVGYALLGFSLLSGGRELASRSPLWVLIAANLAEAAIAAGAYGVVAAHGQVPAAIGVVLHVATMLKWLAALALLVHVAYRICDPDSGPVRQAIRYLFWALWEQRSSVIVVVFLAVVAAGRGYDVLEQMPDVMRSWLTWPPGRGWVHAAVAVTAQLLLALLLMFLGRMRTRRAEQKYSGQDSRRQQASGSGKIVPGLTGYAAATSAAENTIPDQIIFVSPRTESAISAPLGWVLSTASRDTLKRELGETENSSLRCVHPGGSPSESLPARRRPTRRPLPADPRRLTG